MDFSDYHSLDTLTFGLVLLPNAAWNENIWRDVCRILNSLPVDRASLLELTFELSTDRLDYKFHVALDSNWRTLDTTLFGRCKSVRFLPPRKSYHTPAADCLDAGMQRHISEMLPRLAEAKCLKFE